MNKERSIDHQREINLEANNKKKDKTLSEYATDWNNIDLERGVERDKNILEPYSFETLLLEIHCNLRLINWDTVHRQMKDSIQAKANEAMEIANANIDNIVKYAQKERDS